MKLILTKIKKETPGVISLIFDKPEDFFYYPGQYLDIKLPVNDPFGDTRAFTISSSPTENFLMISFKKGITPFKKYLETLKIGNEVEVSHPAGTFTLDESEPAVFIAGGIGITPFRSIMKYAYDNQLTTPMELIHSNSSEEFPFKDEIKQFQKTLSRLNVRYINSSQNDRIDSETLNSYLLNLNSIFYISGSETFIVDIKKHLIKMGVEEFNIRTDSFDGY